MKKQKEQQTPNTPTGHDAASVATPSAVVVDKKTNMKKQELNHLEELRLAKKVRNSLHVVRLPATARGTDRRRSMVAYPRRRSTTRYSALLRKPPPTTTAPHQQRKSLPAFINALNEDGHEHTNNAKNNNRKHDENRDVVTMTGITEESDSEALRADDAAVAAAEQVPVVPVRPVILQTKPKKARASVLSNAQAFHTMAQFLSGVEEDEDDDDEKEPKNGGGVMRHGPRTPSMRGPHDYDEEEEKDTATPPPPLPPPTTTRKQAIPFYAKPIQRQLWGFPHLVVHIGWNTLFFDLFYVAAAYNLGNLLISVMDNGHEWWRGMAYYVGIFCGLYKGFYTTMLYESQFSIGMRDSDYAHRLLNVVHILVLAFVVLHIKRIELFLDPSKDETFWITFGFFLESLIHIAYKLEVYHYAYYQIDDDDDDDDADHDNDGDEDNDNATKSNTHHHYIGDKISILNQTKFELFTDFIPVSFLYCCSTVISAVLHFQWLTSTTDDDAGADSYDTTASTINHAVEDGYDGSNETQNTDDRMMITDHNHRLLDAIPALVLSSSPRFLGGDEDTTYSDAEISIAADISIALLFVAPIFALLVQGISSRTRYHPMNPDIRSIMVPMNIDFFIHRFGEFTMLFFGEAVMALLIIDTTNAGKEYYTFAMVGVLTVVVLQAFKYECEPNGVPDDNDGDEEDDEEEEEDCHCLWNGMQSMFTYTILTQLLCLGLIAFAMSYKVGLSILEKEVEHDYNSYGDEKKNYDDYGDDNHRMLGGSDPSTVSKDVLAYMYCVSLAIVLVSIELMAYSHQGLKETYSLLFLFREDHRVLDWKQIALKLFKFGLLLVVLTLFLWLNNLPLFAVMGLIVTIVLALAQVIEREYQQRKIFLAVAQVIAREYQQKKDAFDSIVYSVSGAFKKKR